MSVRNEQQLFEQVRKRIIECRKQRGMSQEALADKASLDRVAIGYIETGKRRPMLQTVYRIARAFDMSLSEFLKGL